MATITQNNPTITRQTVSIPASASAPSTSAFGRFINWCDGQERNRFGWLAAALAGHGCALTPLTLFAIILSGNNIVFWIMALVAMGATLVMNLAAQPTKVTIPVFLASIVIDLAIIAICLGVGFDITGTYI